MNKMLVTKHKLRLQGFGLFKELLYNLRVIKLYSNNGFIGMHFNAWNPLSYVCIAFLLIVFYPIAVLIEGRNVLENAWEEDRYGFSVAEHYRENPEDLVYLKLSNEDHDTILPVHYSQYR